MCVRLFFENYVRPRIIVFCVYTNLRRAFAIMSVLFARRIAELIFEHYNFTTSVFSRVQFYNWPPDNTLRLGIYENISYITIIVWWGFFFNFYNTFCVHSHDDKVNTLLNIVAAIIITVGMCNTNGHTKTGG